MLKALDEKRKLEMDPLRLMRKIEVLEDKLKKQTKDYFTELTNYRN